MRRTPQKKAHPKTPSLIGRKTSPTALLSSQMAPIKEKFMILQLKGCGRVQRPIFQKTIRMTAWGVMSIKVALRGPIAQRYPSGSAVQSTLRAPCKARRLGYRETGFI